MPSEFLGTHVDGSENVRGSCRRANGCWLDLFGGLGDGRLDCPAQRFRGTSVVDLFRVRSSESYSKFSVECIRVSRQCGLYQCNEQHFSKSRLAPGASAKYIDAFVPQATK